MNIDRKKEPGDAGTASLLAKTSSARSPRAATLQLLNWLPAAALLLVAVALLLGGCARLPESLDFAGRNNPAPVAPYQPVNHVGIVSLPMELRRVVLLPVCGGDFIPSEVAAGLDPVFAEALQRQARFEVVPVSRAWCRRYFGVDEFSSAAALPHDFLARLAREHAADGVVFVDVTTYSDLRPLSLGVRIKLALFDGPRVVWTYDEILSTADPAIAAGAKAYVRGHAAPGLPVDLSPSALQSPSRFAAYVASTAFGTLPPR